MCPSRSIGRLIATAAAALVLAAVAAPGQALAEGTPRWESAVVTVHVADEAAWAGTDVAAALAAWSPALSMTLTDSADADVTLTTGPNGPMAGATAHTTVEGSRIVACRVDLPAKSAGKDQTYVLTHELGHCLGFASPTTGSHHEHDVVSVMSTGDLADNQSETVTASDLESVRALYR